MKKEQTRSVGTLIRWCFSEKCKLFGIDSADEGCPSCRLPTTRLTHVVVCTDKRGVFMGLAREIDVKTCPKEITMWSVRMCVAWTQMEHGVMGLATKGPGAGCKISGAVEEAVLKDIHAVLRCTPKAVDAWDGEPWSQ